MFAETLGCADKVGALARAVDDEVPDDTVALAGHPGFAIVEQFHIASEDNVYGFFNAAMTLREDSLPLPDLPVDRPLALCFGTEEEGLSRTAHALADHAVTIPMAGFTQSLNVSVSVGIVLYTLTRALRTQAVDWQLPPTARTDLTLTWLIGSATGAESLVRHFLRDRQLPLPEESGGLSES